MVLFPLQQWGIHIYTCSIHFVCSSVPLSIVNMLLSRFDVFIQECMKNPWGISKITSEASKIKCYSNINVAQWRAQDYGCLGPTPWILWMPRTNYLIWMPYSCLSMLIFFKGYPLSIKMRDGCRGRHPSDPLRFTPLIPTWRHKTIPSSYYRRNHLFWGLFNEIYVLNARMPERKRPYISYRYARKHIALCSFS